MYSKAGRVMRESNVFEARGLVEAISDDVIEDGTCVRSLAKSWIG